MIEKIGKVVIEEDYIHIDSFVFDCNDEGNSAGDVLTWAIEELMQARDKVRTVSKAT